MIVDALEDFCPHKIARGRSAFWWPRRTSAIKVTEQPALPVARSLFISDVHLGSQYCQPAWLISLLEKLVPEQLYLVGDFCDGWLLRHDWYWPSLYEELLSKLADLSAAGTKITYLLGNHDRCLQPWVRQFDEFRVVENCVHACADGRRLMVIHGDQFDGSQSRFRRGARISALIHERILGGSHLANRLLAGWGLGRRRFATSLTVPVKSLAHSLGQFKSRSKSWARRHDCDGVLCGHTHHPHLREQAGFIHANCGDWLEHCSAIIETPLGQLELWRLNERGTSVGFRRMAVSPARGRDDESK